MFTLFVCINIYNWILVFFQKHTCIHVNSTAKLLARSGRLVTVNDLTADGIYSRQYPISNISSTVPLILPSWFRPQYDILCNNILSSACDLSLTPSFTHSLTHALTASIRHSVTASLSISCSIYFISRGF